MTEREVRERKTYGFLVAIETPGNTLPAEKLVEIVWNELCVLNFPAFRVDVEEMGEIDCYETENTFIGVTGEEEGA